MAFSKDQNESKPPVGSDFKKTSIDFLPKYFKTPTNEKFLSATVDQLIDSGEVEKINAFIGRKTAQAYKPSDRYLDDVSATRQAYQLEPAAVIRDNLNNIVFYKNYNDYINQLNFFNYGEKDHSKINSQEYYAWNPHIDWDKFVNYREYFWLPTGPAPVAVYGVSKEVTSTYTVKLVNEGDNQAYLFTPNGLTRNPSLKLYRGQTYRFEIDCPGHPIVFSIAKPFLVSDLVFTEDGVETGVVEITIPEDAPNVVYYTSKNDINTGGIFKIYDILENTAIDVENDLLGKKTYTTSAGIPLSNGMKLYFLGNVTPKKYAQGNWYVEGVGTEIILIPESDLETPSTFTGDRDIEFDNEQFDSQGFDVNNSFPGTKDYFTINRASLDRNPWSRYNRWFHRTVIETSAKASNEVVSLDQTQRAKRPIIEFEAGLKLWNFGAKAKPNVHLVDSVTADVFSTIEGSLGYYVDGVELTQGHRVLFLADPDIRVNGRIFEVKFINHLNTRRLTLVEVEDTEPVEGETVLVTAGSYHRGKMYYYINSKWTLAQEKTKLNQQPLFDVVDSTTNSYGDTSIYSASTFAGSTIFEYKSGTIKDSELGINISYRNIGNIGDIVFDFTLHTDSFTYLHQPTIDSSTVTITLDKGYLLKYKNGTFRKVNGWETAATYSKQWVVRQHDISSETNLLAIDVYNNSDILTDLTVKVYLNGNKVESTQYNIETINNQAYVKFVNTLSVNDVVIIKTQSSAKKNSNGFYEFPHNFERNPLNLSMDTFTLGEITNHVQSIADNIVNFNGQTPGVGNLRDLGDISKFGNRVIQHSAPVVLPLYHLASSKFNIIKSIRQAKTDYSKFKRNLLRIAEDYGYDGITRNHLEQILLAAIKDNNKNMPYYLSDMVPFGASFTFNQTVIDNAFDEYPLIFNFSLSAPSEKAVLVYLNDEQLLYGKDYVFTDYGFVKFLTPLAEGDDIKLVQYEKTDGCYIPPTPTKLGLYPKFEPKIYIDDTYQTPTKVIQGHDGSITVAFNDFRDDLLLEFERRIYNNIKVSYDTSLFDITDYISGYYRTTDVSVEELNRALRYEFLQWTSLVDLDYTRHNFLEASNSFTFNYKKFTAPDKATNVPGFWRGIYKLAYDTDRPHTHPWEILGFSEQPQWWETTYGPAPYTSDNLVLWQDVSEGIIRTPGAPVVRNIKFARPTILSHLPVDNQGNLLSPLASGFVTNFVSGQEVGNFLFGDQSPVESAWRRGSEFPFALLTALTLIKPAKVFATGFDRVRQVRDATGQVVYSVTNGNLRLSPKHIFLPSTVKSTSRTFTSGLINFIVDYAISQSVNLVEEYASELENIKINLAANLGGFTSKEKFKLLLDSRSPINQSSVFIPQEDYDIVLNTSSPIDTVIYSGILIEKQPEGFIIRGYCKSIPEFKYFRAIESDSDPIINIGGVSESFVSWEPFKSYYVSQVVRNNNKFYRVLASHTSSSSFESKYFVALPDLPLEGGRGIAIRKKFETDVSLLHYGATLTTIQEVVDFLLGHEKYLISQGFDFNYFNPVLKTVTDFRVAAKEFAFWTTQNWADGSVLAVSPAADEVSFTREHSVVDNIYNKFYNYCVFKQDGNIFDSSFLTNSVRSGNKFALKPKDTTSDGIYNISLNLVQKEHILILNDYTVFNDVIYDQKQGYRQERIKVLGYRTAGWTGNFDVPGFVYDEVKITEWLPWTDYVLGATVKYKEFYYSARKNISGSANFNDTEWFKLSKKPTTQLIPNFDFKARQILDYYDLDTQVFDTEQQQFAQHLIGYQKRKYLENIINDDVSQYKFYQGMIREKGTNNSFSKLFDVVGDLNEESLEFYEEWALRVSQYGGTDAFDEVEYILDEAKFAVNPQPIELVNSISGNEPEDFVYRITPAEVYIKPKKYAHTPLPIKAERNDFVKTAGFVREDEVSVICKNKSDLSLLSIDELKVGDYVWVQNDGTSWNVYRFNQIYLDFAGVSASGKTLTIMLNTPVANRIQAGDYLALSNVSSTIHGVFYITSVDFDRLTLTLNKTYDGSTLNNVSNIISYSFNSQRVNTVTDINLLTLQDKNINETVWVDNIETSEWSVLKYQPSVQKTLYTLEGNAHSSRTFAVSDDNLRMVVRTTVDDLVNVYVRNNSSATWLYDQPIQAESYPDLWSNLGSFGEAFVISNAALIVSAPTVTVANRTSAGYLAFYVYDEDVKKYRFTSVIYPPTLSNTTQFGHKLALFNNTLVVVSKEGAVNTISLLNVENREFFGNFYSFPANVEITDISYSNNILVVGTTEQTVYVFKTADIALANPVVLTCDFCTSTIELLNLSYNHKFGESVAVSKDCTKIAVGIPRYNDNLKTTGAVAVYNINGSVITFDKLVKPHSLDFAGEFGTRVRFTSDNQQMYVHSRTGDRNRTTIFDNDSTTFDLNATEFVDTDRFVGRVDRFDIIDGGIIFAESLNAEYIDPAESFGDKFIVTDRLYDLDLSLAAPYTLYDGIYEYYSSAVSWKTSRTTSGVVDLEKIKSIFLYNIQTSKVLKYLDYVDPIQGKILGIADQELSYKTPFDPAVYTTGTDEVLVDVISGWKTENIGKLWWDLSSTKFLDPYQGNIVYKATVWNAVVDDETVSVYEWVESEYMPSEWDSLADSEEGLAMGISGQSKYGDNVYSVDKKYDNISKTFKNIYYFWVKNKKTTPKNSFRKTPASVVAQYISNPKSSGVEFVSLLDSNKFALVNCDHLITNTDVALNIRYWVVDNKEINIHGHYQLLAEGDISRKLNAKLEQKWFDSLVGYDSRGNEVPDQSLPTKLKYGVLLTPRQSMFIDRLTAVKQFIERINSVLIDRLLVDEYDLSALLSKEPSPAASSRAFDVTVENFSELRFLPTIGIERAILNPIVRDGRIVDVNIISSGFGYIGSPKLVVNGAGTGALLLANLGENGEIVSVEIVNSGFGYDAFTGIFVRPFTALVSADENYKGRWSLYSLDNTKTWFKVRSQSYDTSNFWNYVDWYSSGYSIFTRVDHTVNFAYEIPTLDMSIGETVKISNYGSSGWILLEKIDNQISQNIIVNFKTIGRERGTIQFKDSLYSFTTNNIGFDSAYYDDVDYDGLPVRELEIILNALRDSLLINDLEVVYNQLFFASLRHALNEQPALDWAFKTSFVRSRHSLGSLKQKTVYENDNLGSYEDYITEVKPYRTKIREFISDYNVDDNSKSSVIDFDLPVRYDVDTKSYVPFNVSVTESGIKFDSAYILDAPYNYWVDNVGNNIESIQIVDGGSGYTVAPLIEITGVCKIPATARAYLSNGTVANIVINNPGEGYLTTPVITIIGGAITDSGSVAKAVPVMGAGLVRSINVGIKFDRTTVTNQHSTISVTEHFIGEGARSRYELTWPADIQRDTQIVIVAGDEALLGDYTITNEIDKTAEYTRYIGVLQFTSAPQLNDKVTVTYRKNINLLNAVDRIQYYYDPVVGQVGKDFGQLMSGVDYGGVQITGFDFNIGVGWDAAPWMSSGWDYIDENYTDYLEISNGITRSFILPYTPLMNDIISVYWAGYRDDVVVETIALSGTVGSNVLIISSTEHIMEGQSVIGHGVPEGTKVAGVIGDSVILTNMLTVGIDTLTDEVDLITDDIALVQTDLDEINQLLGSTQVGTAAWGAYNVKKSELENLLSLLIDNLSALEQKAYYTFSNRSFFNQRLDDIAYDRVAVVQETLNQLEDNENVLEDQIFNLNDQVRIQQDVVDETTDLLNFAQQDLNDVNAELATTPPNTPEYDALRDQQADLQNLITSYNNALLGQNVILNGLIDDLNDLQDSLVALAEETRSVTEEYKQLKRLLVNTAAVMNSFVANGVSNGPIIIPNNVDIQAGDKLVFRKLTSDGSFNPDSNYYDTLIEGGDLECQTAMGLNAEDISIDGDGFVTPYTSNAPEEVVPGQVFDTVDIQVYNKISGSAPIIKTQRFISNGVETIYKIAQRVNTGQSILVSVNGEVLTHTIDYSFDVQRSTVRLVTPAPTNAEVIITTLSQNGYNILDLDYFVGDGTTSEFISSIRWEDEYTIFVTVNGQAQGVVSFNTDGTYEKVGNIGFRLATPPAEGAIVNYTIVSGTVDSISKMSVETVVYDGTSNSYILANVPAVALPLESNVLVEHNGKIIRPANMLYFDVTARPGTYKVDETDYLSNSIDTDEMLVYVSGRKLTLGKDYSWNSSTNQLKVKKAAAQLGERLAVCVLTDAEYFITVDENNQASITFTGTHQINDNFTITTFINHNVLEVERSIKEIRQNSSLEVGSTDYYSYADLSAGRIKLKNPAASSEYIWIIRNGSVLVPNNDYILEDGQMVVKINPNLRISSNDKLDIIVFSSKVIKKPYGYRIFKDISNKVVYKRINDEYTTVLVESLHYYDSYIALDDASGFVDPVANNNKPGVIMINGERIEYFRKDGNKLTHLRRGTMGTGVNTSYEVGTVVRDLSSDQTVPYKDEFIVTKLMSDGIERLFPVDFIPMKTIVDAGKAVTTVQDWIEAGYPTELPNTQIQADDIEVFVSGRRLRKHPTMLYNFDLGPDSPIGDEYSDPEFSVDGVNHGTDDVPKGYVRLTRIPPAGATVVIVKRIGKSWSKPGEDLTMATSREATFITAKFVNLPDKNINKYNDSVVNVVLELENGQGTIDDENGNSLEWI